MQDALFTPIETGSLRRDTIAGRVYLTLREAILTTQLKPGEKISEHSVGKWLEVSRTPVREAFGRLVDEELVEVTPQSGTKVSRISTDRVRQAVFVRTTLESEAVARAGERLDHDILDELEISLRRQQRRLGEITTVQHFRNDQAFHSGLMTALGYGNVWRAGQHVAADMTRIQFLMGTNPKHLSDILDDHATVVDLLQKGDIAAAADRMREHLSNAASDMANCQKANPDFFVAD